MAVDPQNENLNGSVFIKDLASCNKATRDKAVKLLRTWLMAQPLVSEQDMKKIWKGLFYCIWHSDKLPVQVDLIERLSSILVSVDLSLSSQYFEIFLLTMRREWSGIDFLRLDKFYLSIRKFLHSLFLLLKKNDWDISLSKRFMGILSEGTLLSVDKYHANGVNYHIAEIFLSEIKEFLPLNLEVFSVILEPFVVVLERSMYKVLIKKVKSDVFDFLLEKGKKLLKLKGGEECGDCNLEVENFGKVAFSIGLSARFLDSASSSTTIQSNRKVLFELHDSFFKLERAATKLSFEVLPLMTKKQDPSEDGSNQMMDSGVDNSENLGDESARSCEEMENGANISENLGDGSCKAMDNGVSNSENLDEGMEDKKLDDGSGQTMDDEHSEDSSCQMNGVGNPGHLDDGSCQNPEDGIKKLLNGHSKVEVSDKEEEMPLCSEKRDDVSNCDSKKRKKKKSKKASDGMSNKSRKKNLDELTKDEEGIGHEQHVAHEENTCTEPEPCIGHLNGSDVLVFDESVISNLQKKFERVAAEAGMDGLDLTEISVSPFLKSRKRKSPASENGQVPCGPSKESNGESRPEKSDGKGVKKVSSTLISPSPIEPKRRNPKRLVNCKQDPCSPDTSALSGGMSAPEKSVEKSVKKVRFSMKSNIVWKPHSPLPPQSLRLPPSATPRGSALKKGLPPGPVRIMKESPVIRVTKPKVRKGRKNVKRVSAAVKRLRKLQANSV
ncbi:hypothetical protein AMTRI_Chr12g275000 [Amborella trichopoda]